MKTETYTVRRFSGIETKYSGPDQERGTLRVADGVNIVPVGALTFGPKWLTAWGQTDLATAIATALSGATANKVHFVTLTRSGYTFLIAWEITAGRPRCMVHVAGTGNPSFTSTSGSAVTAPNNSIYRGKTNSLPWYASRIGDEIWLGNGTDINLAWVSGALALLGPQTTPADVIDISQVQFPACISWVKDPTGVVYGAGNVTYPLRIWATEIPNINYPKPQGLKTSAYSYKDLQVNATAITALSIVGETLIAHLNIGPPMILTGTNTSDGGWKFDQRPMEANAGAINPNCARDTKIAPFYLGSDLEIYAPKQRVAYNKTAWRNEDIATDQSDGDWNVAMTKPISGLDYFVAYDEKGGRFWLWAMMSAGSRQGVYCYDQWGRGVTGPWRYPDFLAMCQLRDENLHGSLVCGMTRDGVFLWSNLSIIGDLAPPAYGTALAAAYQPLSSPPTSDPGIPYIGVDTVNLAFKQVLNGQTLYLADPWSQWSASGSVEPTIFFKNAKLAIIELSETDLGSPDVQKEMISLRLMFERNPYAYLVGVLEVNGYRYGQWLGTWYPLQSWILSIAGMGPTARIRLCIVTFNDQNACLNSLALDFLPSVEN